MAEFVAHSPFGARLRMSATLGLRPFLAARHGDAALVQRGGDLAVSRGVIGEKNRRLAC
jgi:hypothetical protein